MQIYNFDDTILFMHDYSHPEVFLLIITIFLLENIQNSRSATAVQFPNISPKDFNFYFIKSIYNI